MSRSSRPQNIIHQNIYGKSLAITSTEAQLSTTIIENPEMLKYQQERQISAQANAAPGSVGPEASAPKLHSVMNGESLEDIRKVWKCNTRVTRRFGRRPWFLSSSLAEPSEEAGGDENRRRQETDHTVVYRSAGHGVE